MTQGRRLLQKQALNTPYSGPYPEGRGAAQEFDLLLGNTAIVAMAEGRTLADAQHELRRHGDDDRSTRA